MTPAAEGAFVSFLIVHCLTSSVPVVKKLINSKLVRIVVMIFGRELFVPSFLHSSAASSSLMAASLSSRATEMGIMGSPAA